jgi:hypothetical protein
MTDDQAANQRLKKILHGAFSGPPTPLKDVPTKWGKQRADPKNQRPRKRRRQRKKSAA